MLLEWLLHMYPASLSQPPQRYILGIHTRAWVNFILHVVQKYVTNSNANYFLFIFIRIPKLEYLAQ